MPGGGVEPEEEPSVTAVREVLEEAGVMGKLGRCLGVFEVCCITFKKLFYFFLLLEISDYPFRGFKSKRK